MLAPAEYNSWTNLVRASGGLGTHRPHEVLHAFRTALASSPRHAASLVVRGVLLHAEAMRRREVEWAWEASLQVNPTSSRALQLLGSLHFFCSRYNASTEL